MDEKLVETVARAIKAKVPIDYGMRFEEAENYARAVIPIVLEEAAKVGKVEEMCLARRNPPPGDIQDCDWPWCHCDPHAAKVIAALEEQGCLDTNPLARIRAMGGEDG